MSFLFVSDTWSFVCLVSNPANVPRWALGTSTGRARYTKGGERNAANQIPNFTMNFDCSFVLNSAPRADIPKSAADFILTIIFWFTCALNPDAAPRWQPGLHGTRRCKSKCEVSPIIFLGRRRQTSLSFKFFSPSCWFRLNWFCESFLAASAARVVNLPRFYLHLS